MKLTRENIYINLQSKSKEELTELEQITGLSNLHHWNYIHFDTYNNYNGWILYDYLTTVKNKQEVTIQQLKEILQPKDLTLEQQLEKAKAEVKRLEDEIGKPKVGDWYSNKVGNYCFKFGKEHSEATVNKFDFFKKITDQELINKLNNLIK